MAPAHRAVLASGSGTAYIKNAHVRIDILVANAPPRRRAWIEFLGVLVFALPYCLIAIYFSYDFFHTAWQFNEYSDSATGLPWRWIPKGIISIGLILLLAAVISVGLRLVVYLWGPERLRAAAAFPGAKLSHDGVDRPAPLGVPVRRARGAAVHRLPGRLRARRHRDLLRRDRHGVRRVRADDVLQPAAAHLGRHRGANPILVAVPMFIFMGTVLERSGVANDLLHALQVLTRRVPGGLAMSVTLMGTIMAATTGIVGASVVMLTLVALPRDDGSAATRRSSRSAPSPRPGRSAS